MKEYWFRPKSYGYGFCPISREGWLATIVFVGFLFLSAYVNGFFTSEVGAKNGFGFLLNLFIFSGIFTVVFKDKVKGGLQWRWGHKKKQSKKEN